MDSPGWRSEASALPRRTLWGNLLLLLGSIVVGLVALELALGLTHYRYQTHPRVDYLAGYFRNDPDLGADLAPNQPPATVRMRGPSFVTFTNASGCFDHDAPLGDDYVLALGESSTWGYAAREDKWTSSWPQSQVPRSAHWMVTRYTPEVFEETAGLLEP